MIFNVLLVSLCFLGAASGCASTPGDSGPPTDRMALTAVIYPLVAWTTPISRKKRSENVVDGESSTTTTTTVGPSSPETPQSPASDSPNPSESSTTKSPGSSNDHPHQKEQATSERAAEKKVEKAITKSINDAIKKNGFLVPVKNIDFEIPSLKMDLKKGDVKDDIVMKKVSLGVEVTLPYPVATSMWRSLANQVMADLTERGVLVKSLTME